MNSDICKRCWIRKGYKPEDNPWFWKDGRAFCPIIYEGLMCDTGGKIPVGCFYYTEQIVSE